MEGDPIQVKNIHTPSIANSRRGPWRSSLFVAFWMAAAPCHDEAL